MRFAPRSTWPMADVPATTAASPPAASAVSPDSCPLSEPWRSASVRMSPGAPGVRSRIVSRTTRVKSSWPSAAAKPTTAISAGSSVSVTWKASAREWLKPSAARKRVTASTSSRRRPVRRSVSSASSPSSSPRVGGTAVAVVN